MMFFGFVILSLWQTQGQITLWVPLFSVSLRGVPIVILGESPKDMNPRMKAVLRMRGTRAHPNSLTGSPRSRCGREKRVGNVLWFSGVYRCGCRNPGNDE